MHALVASGAFDNLRQLSVKGCRGVRDWAALASKVPRLERLDLGWSGVEHLRWGEVDGEEGEEEEGNSWQQEQATVAEGRGGRLPQADITSGLYSPSPGNDLLSSLITTNQDGWCISPPFSSLVHLSLSSTPALSAAPLAAFLAHLPPALVSLDLSHVGLLPHTLSALLHTSNFFQPTTPSLTHLDLRGNDAFTVRDIRRFEHAWVRQTGQGLEVMHSAVLESDDEEDVRRFVEMVAGARVVSS